MPRTDEEYLLSASRWVMRSAGMFFTWIIHDLASTAPREAWEKFYFSPEWGPSIYWAAGQISWWLMVVAALFAILQFGAALAAPSSEDRRA